MWFFVIIAALLLATIPANIAYSKGKDYMTWYWYGFFLWIIAVIHAAALPYQQPIIVQSGNNPDMQDLEIDSSDLVTQNIVTEFDIKCPVEPISWSIYKNEGATFCNVKFRNLLIGNIKAIKFQVLCYDAFDDPVLQTNDNIVNGIMQDLNISPKKVFGNNYFVRLHNDNVRNIKIVISQVLFANNEVWENSNSDVINMAIKSLEEQELKNLQTVAGQSACCYPNEIGNYWICVCGRYNELNNDSCYRCGRDKNTVFDEYTKSSVEATIKKQKEAIREAEQLKQKQLQESKEKQYKMVKKYLTFGVPSVTIIILLILLYMVFIKPFFLYNNAIGYIKNKQYNKAISAFSEINNYKDSKTKISELMTNQSRSAISAGSYHTVGLKDDGTVVAIGNNDDGQCNVSDWKDIISVSSGSYHTVGLKSDGTVIAVGDNDNGQCNVSAWTNIGQR